MRSSRPHKARAQDDTFINRSSIFRIDPHAAMQQQM